MNELKDNKTVKKWHTRLGEGAKSNRIRYLRYFMEYLHNEDSKFKDYTPDRLIEYQRDATSHARYDVLDQVQAWSHTLEQAKHPDGKPMYRSGTINQMYSTVRSFFAHNRCDLPRDSKFSLSGEVPPVEGDLTIDNIKDIILSCKPVYRAVFLCMFQSAMDRASFKYWNENGYEALMKALENDPKAIRIRFPRRLKIRRKIEKPFHTYIGTDAIDAIRKWLEIRPDDVTVIFTNRFKIPITDCMTDIWASRSFTLGIIKKKRAGFTGNRYGKNIHEMRDVFRSVWEKTPANKNVAEFAMGHQIDPLEYNKACRDMEWTESEYLKALPWLNIMSGGAEMKRVEDELNEKDARIEELEAEVARLRESPIDKNAIVKEILETLAEREKQKKG